MPRRGPTIGTRQIDLLRRLCEASGVSGDEDQVREIVLTELGDGIDDVHVDALGNVLLTKRGRGRRRLRLMLDAHMDEVGFMVVGEDSDGIYQIETIGSIDPQNLPGKQVVVGKDNTPGVIGSKAIHLSKPEELGNLLSTDKLRLDLGPGGKAKIGDRGTFAANFKRTGQTIMSKALDNRLGVTTLIQLVKAAPFQVDLLAAFTVQEEIGLRGAKVAANFFKPDLALVIDATPARDLPMQREGENTRYNTRLGLGPAIYLSHRETIDDPRLVRFLVDTATRQSIPFQFRQPGGGSNDSGGIQRTEAGVPVASVSIPHRYTHSALSVSRIEDWQNTLALLLASVQRLPTDILRRAI